MEVTQLGRFTKGGPAGGQGLKMCVGADVSRRPGVQLNEDLDGSSSLETYLRGDRQPALAELGVGLLTATLWL